MRFLNFWIIFADMMPCRIRTEVFLIYLIEVALTSLVNMRLLKMYIKKMCWIALVVKLQEISDLYVNLYI